METEHPNLRSPYWISSITGLNSLSHDHISEALAHSPDNGETLTLSKLELTDISIEAAEELATRVDANEEGIVRRIALGHNHLTQLPTELALLTRLRYLTLKHNSFSIFPRVLTLLESLDTLDISHNKIRRLPTEPGKLVNLRVFCFSRNKVTRLPTYLSQFKELEVLRADRNPIQWPPKTVMECSNLKDPKGMTEWIQNVQRWIDTESSRVQSDDSGYRERTLFDRSIDEAWRFPPHEGDSDQASRHARTYSVDSNMSLSSITESYHEESPDDLPLNRPPPLHLGILQSGSPESSPINSFGNGLSPGFDYGVDMPSTFEAMQDFESLPLHNRTASYAEDVRHPVASAILEKKSLPDLRKAHSPIYDPLPDLPPQTSPLDNPAEPRSRLTSSKEILSNGATDTGLSHPTTFLASASNRINSVASERNSYFRRLSTLPFSTHSLPQYLINLAESARTFLFAMCQIYQSLEQYATLTLDDRFSVVLRKVLDPAHSDMIELIHTLEHFDSKSRTSLPPPALSRTLIEKCRDCAAAFSKAAHVLALRLQVDSGEDARFSRWMLLEIHAATVEIACAWKSMQRHAGELKTYLSIKEGITFSHPVENLPSSELPTLHTLRVGMSSRIRTARRHAGSFSSKDVEIGKKLPSYEIPPAFAGGVISGPAPFVPTLRTPKRQITLPIISSTPKNSSPLPFWNPNTLPDDRFKFHARQDSFRSNPTVSPLSSPSLQMKTPNVEFPASSKRKVEFEALNAIQHAVDIAPRVWKMIEETFTHSDDNNDVLSILTQARSVSGKLVDIIYKMQNGDAIIERRILQEEAKLFVKMVVKISNLVKAYSVDHSVPSALRSSIVELTNLTEEFAILLHVSSFTPSTPRSFSPMLNSTNLNQDGRLTSSLSRAKSTHSPGVPLSYFTFKDGPRSALPSQTVRTPDLSRRLRHAPDSYNDGTTESG